MSARHHHLLACIAFAACTAAQAQTGPYYIGASQSITRESNLFRLPDQQKDNFEAQGGKTSDTYYTTSLIGGVDQQIGRQRVSGSGAIRANRFSDNDDLNTQTYSLDLGLDWETVANLSGRLAVSANRDLRLDAINENNQRVTKLNAEKTQRLDAVVRLGGQGRLRLEGGYTHRKVSYSLEEVRFREYNEDSVNLGARYRPASAFTFGADLRRTEARYPQRLAALAANPTTGVTNPEDSLIRNQLDLITVWAPGGASSVDARLSFGKTTYEQFAARNYSSPTWGIAWNWQPTGKLRFVSRLYRELGQNADVFSVITSDDSTKRTGLRVRADYELTGKVLLDGAVSVARRERQLTLTQFNVTTEGTDTYREFGFGARWLPTRTISVGCSLRNERRGENSSAQLNEKYSANVFSCFGQFTLQP